MRTILVFPWLAASLVSQTSFVTSPRGLDSVEGNMSMSHWGVSRRLQSIDNTQKGSPMAVKQLAFRRDGLSNSSNAGPRTMDMWIVLGTTPWGILSLNLDDNIVAATAITTFTRKSVNFPGWVGLPATPPAAFDFVLPFDVPFAYAGTDALVWIVHHDLASSTGLTIMDREIVEYTPALNGGTALGTGCLSTGQTVKYIHTMTSSNAAKVAGMALTVGIAAAPANGPIWLFLDTIDSNLTLPGICAVIHAYPTVTLPIGTASATGSLSNRVLQFPYDASLEGKAVVSQAVSLDGGQAGIPISVSGARSTIVPAATFTSGVQCAYQYAALGTATGAVFYGGGMVARLGY